MQKLTKHGEAVHFNWIRAEKGDAIAEAKLSSTLIHVSDYLNSDIKAKVQGIWLTSEDDVAELSEQLDSIEIIGVLFPVFTDGRGFSHARKLREVLAYEDELVALGAFMQDQLFYLKRCGFDAFTLQEGTSVQSACESLADFSEAYQAASDEPRPLFRRR